MQTDRNINTHKNFINGAFIIIKNIGNFLHVHQDNIGAYGIYIFQSKNYFAISNSFVYLVEHLRNRFQLTFNHKYAEFFLYSPLTSCHPEETLINEIILCPRNVELIIDKVNNKLSFNFIDYHPYSIDINSPQAIELIDFWIDKWINIIRNLYNSHCKISVDLSGGFDSRVVFALFVAAGIDMSKINIHSYTDKHVSHAEDLEIANSIAKYFNIKLNIPLNIGQFDLNLKQSIDIAYYLKLGFNKHIKFNNKINREIVFKFDGGGGELLRGYWLRSKNSFYSMLEGHALEINKNLSKNLKELLDNIYCKYKNKFKLPEGFISMMIFRDTINRFHFGKSMVHNYFRNMLVFSPLCDHIFESMKIDHKNIFLLPALLYDRICAPLLNFKFNDNRFIPNETVLQAKSINKRYPPKHSHNNGTYKLIISSHEYSESVKKNGYVKNNERNTSILASTSLSANEWFKSVYHSPTIVNLFLKNFSPEIYDFAEKYLHTVDFFPIQYAMPIVAISKTIYDCKVSCLSDNNLKLFDQLSSFIKLDYKPNYKDYLYVLPMLRENALSLSLQQLFMARIFIFHSSRFCKDFIINGTGLDHGFGDINSSFNLLKPTFFKGKSIKGCIIEKSGSSLTLDIYLPSEGRLLFYLGTAGISSFNNKSINIPLKLLFTSFKINNEEMLKNPYPSNNYLPMYEIMCGKFTLLHLSFQWKIYPYDMKQLINIFSELVSVSENRNINLQSYI